MNFNCVPFFRVLVLGCMISAAGMCLPYSVMGVQDLDEAFRQTFDQEWTGDFDKMVEKKFIRALVPNSKTFYFLDRATPKGISYDLLKLFEGHLNKKLKTKYLKVHVVAIPTPRDRLIPGLVEGLGDIAVGNLTITEDRLKSIDFSDPMLKGIHEILVTGPASPIINSLSDLSGQTIHVRKSSSYY